MTEVTALVDALHYVLMLTPEAPDFAFVSLTWETYHNETVSLTLSRNVATLDHD
jgi:hypothetical protein